MLYRIILILYLQVLTDKQRRGLKYLYQPVEELEGPCRDLIQFQHQNYRQLLNVV